MTFSTIHFHFVLSLGAVIAIFSGIMYFQDKISFDVTTPAWNNIDGIDGIAISQQTSKNTIHVKAVNNHGLLKYSWKICC